MIHFRIRDFLSVLLYRTALRPFFGAFGRRVRVVHPLRLVGARHMRLGDHVTLQYGAYIAVLPSQQHTPALNVGTGTLVGNHAHIICTRRIAIGKKVLIADRVYISDNLHEYRNVEHAVLDQPLRQLADVEIGDGSWIGENVCIIGCTIGRHSTIGANSVVTRDIPDHCVAIGSPAVPIKRYCHEQRRWRRTDPRGDFID